MDPAVTSLCLNLTATGVAAGTGVTVSGVRDIFRRKKYDENLEDVATVFAESLEDAIKAKDARLDTNELAGATDDWEAVLDEVAGLMTGESSDSRSRERDQIGHLFHNEEDAAIQIAEAIATVQGFDLSKTPQLREELISAVGDAYAEAIANFERHIASTDLGDVFQQELQLDIREAVNDLQTRLAQIGEDIEILLTQDARNEGFRQLSSTFFARGEPTPETSWRTTFSLGDVHAGIPARRDGYGDTYADEELLTPLRESEDRFVIGRAGAGKSTLCKQVAVTWHQDTETGTVLYRDSDDAGAAFESRDALREAIERADGHVLVVVEDAIRANANAIFRLIEEYGIDTDVTFLLDAREAELDTEPDAQTLDRGSERRHREIASAIERYELPEISEADIARTIDAFEEATGTTVERSATVLHDELQSEATEGFGAFLLLSFHLPFGDTAVERDDTETGLEAHVRSRYQTLMQPGSDGTLRDLSRFDRDLLADVGVMVNLLNASGIGIYPELVHTLGYEFGHDIGTHDEIHEIRETLEGWFLFQTGDKEEQVLTTHELWSTLYLRALARDHQQQQTDSRRRDRSEPHAARCMNALFALFDEDSHREAIEREFPGSSVMTAIDADTDVKADEYVRPIFELVERWPVLAPLAGTTNTARYDLPAACSDQTHQWVTANRGHAHRHRGAYQKAQTEYEKRLNEAQDTGDRQGEAKSLDNLGVVAKNLGEYENAREYLQQSLTIFRDIDNRQGEAQSLGNLGAVAENLGEYEDARKYLQESLVIKRNIGNRQGEAESLGHLGVVAKNQGGYEDAQEYHRQSLEIFRDIGDRQGEARSLGNLGVVARHVGEYEDAREYYQQSLAIFRDIGDRQLEATSLGNIGLVARHLGEYENAREYHQQSLAIERDIGNRRGEATSLNNLGLVAQKLGEYENAREYHQQSLEIFRDIGDRQREARSLNNLGLVARHLDEYGNAREYHQQSLTIFRNIGDRQGEAKNLDNLGMVAAELGEQEEAREYYQQSLRIFRELEHTYAERVESHLEELSEDG
ncbi:tetratricopeptide repeat protein [Halobellus ruber]|uniref:Tetratricopeptide repeat protein n=1 Tax=Halobellus ruber TaxID=2761102 RepID=A0A7J9SFJ1_9EURY|nr:tetratricopeptide repeat protein [Halobellus ruber]MBB6645735.1 tetratricopeptide repeat protein [Halobellus ruber]